MKKSITSKKRVYCLSEGYSPYISQSGYGLAYCFPVSSGHVDLEFEFNISKQDFNILKSSNLKFKALYFLLFHEVQETFGTGHSKPRPYTTEEFKVVKNEVLSKSELDLKSFLMKFSKQKNLGVDHFHSFCKNVFGNEIL